MGQTRVVEEHGVALIECECGEFISLSCDAPPETCDGCGRQYCLDVRVVAVTPEPIILQGVEVAV